MSTKIYDAVLIPTSNMKALIGVGQKIAKIHQDDMIGELSAKYSLEFPEGYDFDKLHPILLQTIALSKANDTIIFKTKDRKMLEYYIEQEKLDIGREELNKLIDLCEDICKCQVLSFLRLDAGRTLMKWYTLSPEAEKWVYDHFPDYHYQNQTDGYTLEEVAPEFAKEYREYLSDREEELDENTLEKAEYWITEVLYGQRGKDWGKAMGNHWNFAECSLTFHLMTGRMDEQMMARHIFGRIQYNNLVAEKVEKYKQRKAKDEEWLKRYLEQQQKEKGATTEC